MPKYAVAFKASALREIRTLPAAVANRVIARIESLALDPRPPGCKKLQGFTDLWRIRVGDWRVVYSVADRTVTVQVLRIAHRREVYD